MGHSKNQMIHDWFVQDVRIDGEKMTAFQALLSEVLKGNYVYTYAFY